MKANIFAPPIAVCLAIGLAVCQPNAAWGQTRLSRRPTLPEVKNDLPTKMPQVNHNEVIQPIPLSANRLEAAREGVSNQIRNELEDLQAMIKPLFPDSLDALAETGHWSPAQRNALSKAVKAVDSEAVYAAWLEAEPDNTTGAERIARQTAVQRAFQTLQQHARDGAIEPNQVADLSDELGKLGKIQPIDDDVTNSLQNLRTWADIQQILAAVEPEPTGVAKLPTGTVRLIYNPNLAEGAAIVLNENTVMVGNRGQGGVKIGKGNAAEALGLPVIADKPLADAEGLTATDGALLINPRSTGATVHYVVNGHAYVMEPGMSQWLPSGTDWYVEFDRGGEVGFSRYVLPDGTYRFTPTDTGWELYRHRFDVTIDNSRNSKDFHFVADDQRAVVRPGHTATLSSAYPIVLRYDRGNSSGMARKVLNFSGTVEVAINAADNHWDVFREEGNKKRVLDTEIFD